MKNSKSLHIISIVLLLIYTGFIIYVTLLNRTPAEEYNYNFKLFWSYPSLFDETSAIGPQIFLNILLFIPFGFLLTLFLKGPGIKSLIFVIIFSCLFSVLIETAQLIFKLGLAEFDDVFDNTLGAALGSSMALTLKGIFKN